MPLGFEKADTLIIIHHGDFMCRLLTQQTDHNSHACSNVRIQDEGQPKCFALQY